MGLPIDNGDSLAIRTIAVTQQGIVHAHKFEAFHDSERGAWDDGFDCSRRWCIVSAVGGWCRLGECAGGEGLRLDEADAMCEAGRC